MNRRLFPGYFLRIIFFVLLGMQPAFSQIIDMSKDSTGLKGDGIISFLQRHVNLRLSGYLQPQFQAASSEGAQTYAAGNFAPGVNNRFMIRRGRFRLDYFRTNEEQLPTVFFGLQFDGTERGVNIRDFYGKFFENKWSVLAVTTGMFPRPFGHELLLSSNMRETPERGRMSQILMMTERDLGAMLTFEPQRKDHPLYWLKMDAGIFNGPGLPGTADFDKYKDFIGRAATRQLPLGKSPRWSAKGGASVYLGGIVQTSKYVYRAEDGGDQAPLMQLDSALSNAKSKAPRRYFGADIQIFRKCKAGQTEFRLEFIAGKQPAIASSSQSPFSLPRDAAGNPLPIYIRPFNGAYFYILQNIFSPRHQVFAKYDWYDPNTEVKGKEISAERGFSPADIRYDTYGLGYIWYANDNIKFLFYYDLVFNEETSLPAYQSDLSDNIFTSRVQYRF